MLRPLIPSHPFLFKLYNHLFPRHPWQARRIACLPSDAHLIQGFLHCNFLPRSFTVLLCDFSLKIWLMSAAAAELLMDFSARLCWDWGGLFVVVNALWESGLWNPIHWSERNAVISVEDSIFSPCSVVSACSAGLSESHNWAHGGFQSFYYYYICVDSLENWDKNHVGLFARTVNENSYRLCGL